MLTIRSQVKAESFRLPLILLLQATTGRQWQAREMRRTLLLSDKTRFWSFLPDAAPIITTWLWVLLEMSRKRNSLLGKH